MTRQDSYQVVANAIQEVTGLDASEITLDADLAEDLEIDQLQAFPHIMKLINQSLDDELPLRNANFISELKKCETVADLVDLVESESEF